MAELPRDGLRPFRHRWRAVREGTRRDERGFGLIELLIAMVILNIGLLAIIASFQAGIFTLSRASRVTTASVLGDQQMELYRGISYSSIRLASATIPSSAPYTTDTAYTCGDCTPLLTSPACSGPPFPAECNASRTAPGADGKSYRVDTYISQTTPSGGRPLKRVIVVVRDADNLSRAYARQVSTFDEATG